MQGRITPEYIKKLEPGCVFIFGSNLIGNHGKGAAKTALKWGAKPGQGAGLMGRTWGIPTKGKSMNHVLPVDTIARYVDELITFARTNPRFEDGTPMIFLVTEIGCGLAHYKPKDIAPLFREAIGLNNIHLPRRFWNKLIPDGRG